MDAAGDFVVACTRSDAAGAAVHAQRYHADGIPDGAQLLVNEPSSKTVVPGATVAMDDDCDFVVAWEQGREVRSGNGFSCSYGVGLCPLLAWYYVTRRRFTVS